MHLRSIFITLTLAVVVAAPVAQTAPKAAPKMTNADWQKMYDQAEEYFAKKDADGIFGTMTPDFTLIMNGQKMNAKQAKAAMMQWFEMASTITCEMKVVKSGQSGLAATVYDTYRQWGTMTNPQTKKPGKFVDTGKEKMTWVWRNGKWQIKRLEITEMKMTLDGKPFGWGG